MAQYTPTRSNTPPRSSKRYPRRSRLLGYCAIGIAESERCLRSLRLRRCQPERKTVLYDVMGARSGDGLFRISRCFSRNPPMTAVALQIRITVGRSIHRRRIGSGGKSVVETVAARNCRRRRRQRARAPPMVTPMFEPFRFVENGQSPQYIGRWLAIVALSRHCASSCSGITTIFGFNHRAGQHEVHALGGHILRIVDGLWPVYGPHLARLLFAELGGARDGNPRPARSVRMAASGAAAQRFPVRLARRARCQVISSRCALWAGVRRRVRHARWGCWKACLKVALLIGRYVRYPMSALNRMSLFHMTARNPTSTPLYWESGYSLCR